MITLLFNFLTQAILYIGSINKKYNDKNHFDVLIGISVLGSPELKKYFFTKCMPVYVSSMREKTTQSIFPSNLPQTYQNGPL